jgi:hypothetical protein
MQSFLCQILAYYVIFLASSLKLNINHETEQFILQAAATRWQKQGTFFWDPAPDGEVDLSFETSKSEVEQGCKSAELEGSPGDRLMNLSDDIQEVSHCRLLLDDSAVDCFTKKLPSSLIRRLSDNSND